MRIPRGVLRSLLLGAAVGTALGVVAAAAEVAWVAWSVRAAGFRPELLGYAAILYGGLGLALGLGIGAARGAWIARRARTPFAPRREPDTEAAERRNPGARGHGSRATLPPAS